MNKQVDIVVIGGSIGGVLASYSALKSGKKVALVEQTDWIGGQLTNQAVPPDEHQWIEQTGCTKTYRQFRNDVRDYYKNHPFIIDELKTKEFFCPGGSWVSRLSHDPRLALKLLNGMLDSIKGDLTIYLSSNLIKVYGDSFTINSVDILTQGKVVNLKADYFLDGTDIGDLIKQSGTEYKTGAESKSMFNELHAPLIANSSDMQPITYVAGVEYVNGGDFVIDKPYMYDYFANLNMPYDNYKVLSMRGPDSSTGKSKEFGWFSGDIGESGQKLMPLFTYRRIICANHFKDNYVPYDTTLINLPQNDYFMDNIFDTSDDKGNIEMSKQLTLSYIYYLQTEAKRVDGGKGYRGLRLNGEPLGTKDGLAKAPYIRESRRIVSDFTITENMISKSLNKSPITFHDSVGVGSYHIDLHITTKTHTFFFDNAHPFEIPLRSFIPKKMTNLIPACKNIATTHLTNGCYRLHPIEWNIGEVAGFLASYCIDKKITPKEVAYNELHLNEFLYLIKDNGIQTKW